MRVACERACNGGLGIDTELPRCEKHEIKHHGRIVALRPCYDGLIPLEIHFGSAKISNDRCRNVSSFPVLKETIERNLTFAMSI